MPFSSGSDQYTFTGTGDAQDWALLYSRWYGKLFNYGRKFCSDSGLIEDVIQNVFLCLYQRGMLNVHNQTSYIFTSFRNNLLRQIRQQRKNTCESLNETYDFQIELAADQRVIRNERQKENIRKIEKALSGLTVRQKEFIFLKFYQQMKYEEISEVMDISVKAVYKLAARAIQLLRRELESEQFMLIATLLA